MAFASEAALWRRMSVGPFADEADFLNWLAQAEAATDTVFYAFCPTRDGRACGVTSYLRDTPAMGVIEIGNIIYAPGVKGTPASTEATALLLAQATGAWSGNATHAISRRAGRLSGVASVLRAFFATT